MHVCALTLGRTLTKPTRPLLVSRRWQVEVRLRLRLGQQQPHDVQRGLRHPAEPVRGQQQRVERGRHGRLGRRRPPQALHRQQRRHPQPGGHSPQPAGGARAHGTVGLLGAVGRGDGRGREAEREQDQRGVAGRQGRQAGRQSTFAMATFIINGDKVPSQ